MASISLCLKSSSPPPYLNFVQQPSNNKSFDFVCRRLPLPNNNSSSSSNSKIMSKRSLSFVNSHAIPRSLIVKCSQSDANLAFKEQDETKTRHSDEMLVGSGNKYWILRHGKSIPNHNGIIVSSMENGILEKYQLASKGVTEALLAGDLFFSQLNDNNIPLDNVRICYSPFSRTTHTASLVASSLSLPFPASHQCMVVEDLRERYFGPTFELMSHDKYPEVWALDDKDPFMPPPGGESVAQVATRLTTAITRIDSLFQGCAILIVSHGDPLQILQTIVNAAVNKQGTTESESGCGDLRSRLEAVQNAVVLSNHRNYGLETAELRRLI